MVDFGTRVGGEREGPWPIDINHDEGKIILPANNEAAANSIINFIYEGGLDNQFPFWFGFEYRQRHDIDYPSVILSGVNSKGEDENAHDVGVISSREHPDGCEIEVQIYPRQFDNMDFSDSITFDGPNPTDVGNSILNFILQNRERVTLGYATEHIFDDIEPIHTDKDLTSMSCSNILKQYNPWVQEIISRTRSSLHEYAFYIDEAGNTIGVIEGKRNSVSMPPLDDNKEQVSFHTHPRVKSSIVPSENDICHANKALQIGGRMFIIYGGGSLFFEEARSDWGEDKPDQPFDKDTPDNPESFDVGVHSLCVEKVKMGRQTQIEQVIYNNQHKLRIAKDNLFDDVRQEASEKLEGINENYQSVIRDDIQEGEENMEAGIKSDQPHFERMREIAEDEGVTFIYKPVSIQP